MAIIAIGMILQGIGKSPRQAFITTYIDNNVKKTQTAVYVEFFKSIYGLFRNKLYVLIIVGRCLILILVSGSVAFGPKYIETQFTLPAWKSSLVIGVTRIFAVSVGTFVGGYLTSKKRISPLGCGGLIVILSLFTILQYLVQIFLGCPTPEIIGYNRNLSNSSDICTSNCNCNSEDYFPVCGSDNNNYFSPCHAGCSSISTLQGFTNCTCIGPTATGKPGLCSSDCQMLVPYLVVTCVFSLVESLGIMPSLIFMLRSVKENQKGIAIAFSAFITTLLGWFLGPIIFGEIIDMCCKIWSSRCGVKGSCALYNNVNFRYATYGFSLILRCIVLIIDIVAYLIARKKTDWSTGETRRERKNELPEKQSFIVDEGDTNGNNSYIKTFLENKEFKETNILC
ncbi:solute carrier organic anion transporter family member 3A1-like [Mytilus californianus]|uniref:solute carrier organic anion transporter family member 3A1-like n=1 Tax=Mytilus californianus TaxID=6549 RepID=UPI0022474297|nr:solute carrier organic anion transporter family member 3A1-like [Mytilus californianus]